MVRRRVAKEGLRASNIDWSAFGFTIVQWSADGNGWWLTTLGYLRAISSIHPLLQASQHATNNITIDLTDSKNNWLERLVGMKPKHLYIQNTLPISVQCNMHEEHIQNRTLSGKLSSLEFPFFLWLFLLGDYTDTICPNASGSRVGWNDLNFGSSEAHCETS